MGIDESIPFIPFPDWLCRVMPDSDVAPDQITVQHYPPGAGIPPHCDTHSPFSHVIYALSLGSPILMEFQKGTEKVSVDLPPKSMLVMSGESRLHWTHTVKKRKNDWFDEIARSRENRWSITYRCLRHRPCECGNLELCDTAKSKIGMNKTFRWQEHWT